MKHDLYLRGALSRPEESIRSSGTIDACHLPRRCWKLSLGPLKEQQVLSTADPPLQVLITDRFSVCLFLRLFCTWSGVCAFRLSCLILLPFFGPNALSLFLRVFCCCHFRADAADYRAHPWPSSCGFIFLYSPRQCKNSLLPSIFSFTLSTGIYSL